MRTFRAIVLCAAAAVAMAIPARAAPPALEAVCPIEEPARPSLELWEDEPAAR